MFNPTYSSIFKTETLTINYYNFSNEVNKSFYNSHLKDTSHDYSSIFSNLPFKHEYNNLSSPSELNNDLVYSEKGNNCIVC